MDISDDFIYSLYFQPKPVMLPITVISTHSVDMMNIHKDMFVYVILATGKLALRISR